VASGGVNFGGFGQLIQAMASFGANHDWVAPLNPTSPNPETDAFLIAAKPSESWHG